MSQKATASPQRRTKIADAEYEDRDRPDRRDGFGGLSVAADKHATFYIHSQPVYKMAHNCGVAMSSAHLPPHALAIFGEVTQCTEFVGRALDMIPYELGGHHEPLPGYIPDEDTLAVARAVRAYRGSASKRGSGVSGGASEPPSPPRKASDRSPPATEGISLASPAQNRSAINQWRRHKEMLTFDIDNLRDVIARLSSAVESCGVERSKYADVAREERNAAAQEMDLSARRARNDAISTREKDLTAAHKASIQELEDAREEVELLISRREAHDTIEPKTGDRSGVDLEAAFAALSPLSSGPGASIRASPTKPPAPVGDGSDAGSPDRAAFMQRRTEATRAPKEPSQGPVPTTGVTDDCKAIQLAVSMTMTQTTAAAILESAMSTYPMLHGALLRRQAGGLRLGSHRALPTACTHNLALAQLHQNIGMDMCAASASADIANGGVMGKELATIINDRKHFDMRAARICDDPDFPVEQHVLEVLGGVIPLLAFAFELCSRLHNPAHKGITQELVRMAKDIRLAKGSSLQLVDGMMAFNTAYSHAMSDELAIDPTPIYRAILNAVVRANTCTCIIAGRDWQRESSAFTNSAGQRLLHNEAADIKITRQELNILLEWLTDFGYDVAKGETALARVGEADGNAFSARTAPAEALDTVRDIIRGFQVNAESLYRSQREGDGRLTQAAFPGLAKAQRQFRRAPVQLPCWQAACSSTVGPGWLGCPGCITLHPDTVRCTVGSCTSTFRTARCTNPACGAPRESGELVSAREDLTASATLLILGGQPYPRSMIMDERGLDEHREGAAKTASAPAPSPSKTPATVCAVAQGRGTATGTTAGGPPPLTLAIPAVIMEGAPCVLSLGTVAAADWVLVTSQNRSIPSCLHLPSTGAVKLRASGAHDLLFDLIPHASSTEGHPVWTPYEVPPSGIIPAECVSMLIDTGSHLTIFPPRLCDALQDVNPHVQGIIGIGGGRTVTSGKGLLHVVIDRTPGYPTDEYFASVLSPGEHGSPSTLTQTRISAARAVPSYTAEEEELCTVFAATEEVTQAGLRPCTYPRIVSPVVLADRLQLKRPADVNDYHKMAAGVAPMTCTEEDLRELTSAHKATGKRHPIRVRINAYSFDKHATIEPGECFYTDVSNVRPADASGLQYSRLAVCAATTYGHLTFDGRKHGTSLIAHMRELVRLSEASGHKLRLLRMDFASEAVVQGRGDDVITGEVAAFLDEPGNRGLRIVANPPYTPEHNRAENARGVLNVMCFVNHHRAGVGLLGWAPIEMGSLFQYNRHAPRFARDPKARSKTRLEAFTGKSWDASTMLGFVAQGCWVSRNDGKLNEGRARMEAALYICPSETTSGHLVLLLRDLKLHVVQTPAMLKDGLRLSALARSALHGPGDSIIHPEPESFAAKLQSLFLPYVGDVSTSAVECNKFSGDPIRLHHMRYTVDEEDVLRIQAVRDAAADAADATPDRYRDFVPCPMVTGPEGARTMQRGLMKALRLRPETRIRFDPDGKRPKEGAAPTASRSRYIEYRHATDVQSFYDTHPHRHGKASEDLVNDLIKGLCLLHADDVPDAAPDEDAFTAHADEGGHADAYLYLPAQEDSAGNRALPRHLIKRIAPEARIQVMRREGGRPNNKGLWVHTTREAHGEKNFARGLAIGSIRVHRDDMHLPRDHVPLRAPSRPCPPPTVRVFRAGADDFDISVRGGVRRAHGDPIDPRMAREEWRLMEERSPRPVSGAFNAQPRAFHAASDYRVDLRATRALATSIDDAILHARDMARLEGTLVNDHSTDDAMQDVIGDQRQYSEAYREGARACRAAVAADHAPELVDTESLEIDTATACMMEAPSPTTPSSVPNATRRADFAGPNGWGQAIGKEVARVEGFKAWQLVPASHLNTTRRAFPGQVSVGHIVVAFRNKVDADGKPLADGKAKKARIALADTAGNITLQDGYSGCVDDITDRIITVMGTRMGAQADTADVGGAYFHGEPIPLEQGGRAAYAFVPAWLAAYGDYPTHDNAGRRNYLRIWGNMPGKRDAGPTWQRRYDRFLLGLGFRKSVVDRRLFSITTDLGTMLLHIHVDDTRMTFDSQKIRTWFLGAWAAEFDEKPASATLDSNFVGVRRAQMDPHTMELSCVGVIKSMIELIAPFPLPAGVTCAHPMSATTPRELREGPTEKNQLVPELAAITRRIVGTIGFVTTHVRADAYFAFCVCAGHMGEARLTRRAFAAVLRLAHYLKDTMHMPLVLHTEPSSVGTRAWGAGGIIETFVDTSHGNAPDGKSYGGFVIMNKCGGGALAWKCVLQEVAVDSAGGQELYMCTLAYKFTLAVRLLLNDLGLGETLDPTPFFTDSSIVLDGTRCERLMKASRFGAARYAMLRFGMENGQIVALKVDSLDNVADITTKPLTGESFFKHRATILGLKYRISVDPS